MIRAAAPDALVNPADIAAIELFILKRMRELALGNHASVSRGAGVAVAGLHPWESGDRLASIDWAQSSLTNFNPIMTREFEQHSNATIVAVADASLSTRYGAGEVSIAAVIARTLATIGLSAALFQDMFGATTFDDRFNQVTSVRPAVGKSHVIHCLTEYQRGGSSIRRRTLRRIPKNGARADSATALIAGSLRRPALVAVISDFLFADAVRAIEDLAALNVVHDVLLLMIDARFAFDVPEVAAGWVEVRDAETGATRVVSRREFSCLAARVGEWQLEMIRHAHRLKLDVVPVDPRCRAFETALVELVAERRLRKA
jgi:uncharacterized protein (DUF58 family)